MRAALRNALSQQSPHEQLWPPGVLSPLWSLCSCLLTRGCVCLLYCVLPWSEGADGKPSSSVIPLGPVALRFLGCRASEPR